MRKKGFSKPRAKRVNGCCAFCGEDDVKLLDVHRILDGQFGGTYCPRNTVVLCSLCHRKTTVGNIVISGKHYTTGGYWLVFYTENDEEKTAKTIC